MRPRTPSFVTAIGMLVEVQNADEVAQTVITKEACHRWLEVLERQVAEYGEGSGVAGAVCIRVCGEEESRTLNLNYRRIDKPTNVLSFPAEVSVGDPILGDLAICFPVVEAEAQAQKKSLQDHAAHLVVHGILHLLGFDHEQEVDAADMESIEVNILDELGITNPYL